jgi:alcohol dehydrogenase
MRVHQFGKHRTKLRISEHAGVDVELVRKRLPCGRYDWVVDATGSAKALRLAVEMTRPRGTVVMKSTIHGMVSVDTAPVIVNEITLIGSRCGRFEPALELLRRRCINLEDMISSEFPLADASRAFQHAAKPGILKVLLR